MLAWAESIPPDELYHAFELDETSAPPGSPTAVFYLGDLRVLGALAYYQSFEPIIDHYAALWEIPREEIELSDSIRDDYLEHSICFELLRVIAEVLNKEQIYLDAFKRLPSLNDFCNDFILSVDLQFANGQQFTAETIRRILAGNPASGLSPSEVARLFGA